MDTGASALWHAFRVTFEGLSDALMSIVNEEWKNLSEREKPYQKNISQMYINRNTQAFFTVV